MQARHLGGNLKPWMSRKKDGKKIESGMHG
jgi:hypothetical protein